jgi:hypothetical protein
LPYVFGSSDHATIMHRLAVAAVVSRVGLGGGSEGASEGEGFVRAAVASIISSRPYCGVVAGGGVECGGGGDRGLEREGELSVGGGGECLWN